MFPDKVLRLPATSQRSAGMADVFPLPPAFSVTFSDILM